MKPKPTRQAAIPHHPTAGNHAARLLNFTLTDPAISCSCLSCVRTRVILSLPARIIAAADRLSTDDINAITAATVGMLADLEAAEARQLQQQRENDDDIPF